MEHHCLLCRTAETLKTCRLGRGWELGLLGRELGVGRRGGAVARLRPLHCPVLGVFHWKRACLLVFLQYYSGRAQLYGQFLRGLCHSLALFSHHSHQFNTFLHEIQHTCNEILEYFRLEIL
jgi:hypothetical protein